MLSSTEFVPKFKKTYNAPTIHAVCMIVMWVFDSANSPGTPLNKGEKWPEFNALSEWFRTVICAQLNLAMGVSWPFLWNITGCNGLDSYTSPKVWAEAQAYGDSHTVKDARAIEMYEALDAIRYEITR